MKSKAEVSEPVNTTHSSALSFSGLVDLFYFSNITVGLCTAAAAAAAFYIHGLTVNLSALLFIFCSTIFIYNLERLHSSPADNLNFPERSFWICQNKSFLTKVNLILISVCFYLLITHFSTVLLSTAFALLISCLCYNSKLRNIPAMKNIMVAVIWAATASIFPLLWIKGLQFNINVNFTLICFGCALMNTILFDLRDAKGDKLYGIKSIPVIFSKKLCFLLYIGIGLAVIILSISANLEALSLIPGIYLFLFFSEETRLKYIIADLTLAIPVLLMI